MQGDRGVGVGAGIDDQCASKTLRATSWIQVTILPFAVALPAGDLETEFERPS